MLPGKRRVRQVLRGGAGAHRNGHVPAERHVVPLLGRLVLVRGAQLPVRSGNLRRQLLRQRRIRNPAADGLAGAAQCLLWTQRLSASALASSMTRNRTRAKRARIPWCQPRRGWRVLPRCACPACYAKETGGTPPPWWRSHPVPVCVRARSEMHVRASALDTARGILRPPTARLHALRGQLADHLAQRRVLAACVAGRARALRCALKHARRGGCAFSARPHQRWQRRPCRARRRSARSAGGARLRALSWLRGGGGGAGGARE